MIRRLFAILFLHAGLLDAGSPAAGLIGKPDSWFGSDEGRKTLEYILSWQSDRGDWPKNTDTARTEFRGDRAKLRGTFDNGATTDELRVLGRAFGITGEARHKQAFLVGFDHILAAQYPNGGWPQFHPSGKQYHRRITFNDGTMVRLMEFLREAAISGDDGILDPDRRAAARRAVDRGVDCMVRCQIVIDGAPTVWCAQHDEVTLAPADGRSYELASLSGAESAGVLVFLMSLEDPTPEVVRAVKGGVAWFEAVKIEGVRYKKSGKEPNLVEDPSAPPIWARFYEIGTNRPFFCDRDGVKKYALEEIGAERRGGYSWYTNAGEKVVRAFVRWPHR